LPPYSVKPNITLTRTPKPHTAAGVAVSVPRATTLELQWCWAGDGAGAAVIGPRDGQRAHPGRALALTPLTCI